LVKLPASRARQATVRTRSLVGRLIWSICRVPVIRHIRATPRIIIPSEAPIITRVFFAAAELLSSVLGISW